MFCRVGTERSAWPQESEPWPSPSVCHLGSVFVAGETRETCYFLGGEAMASNLLAGETGEDYVTQRQTELHKDLLFCLPGDSACVNPQLGFVADAKIAA